MISMRTSTNKWIGKQMKQSFITKFCIFIWLYRKNRLSLQPEKGNRFLVKPNSVELIKYNF